MGAHLRMEPNSIHRLTEMNHSNSKLVWDKLSRDGKKVSWACALVKRGDSLFPQNSVMEIRVLVKSSPVVLLCSLTLSYLRLKMVQHPSMCLSKWTLMLIQPCPERN